ncbi:MAG: hypothetical protein ACR2G2_18065 [Pseudonocardia sp.]
MVESGATGPGGSLEAAERLGCTPLAKVTRTALVGCDPVLMLEAPAR